MPAGIYLHVHVPRAIALGLRLRGVDVIRAQEDGAQQLPDPELLDRASLLHRVLFTFDDDLLVEARKRQRAGISFGGLIYSHPFRITIGKCVVDLEIIAKSCGPEDLSHQVLYLPL
jgi:Domain of unknown function (DUF5615)